MRLESGLLFFMIFIFSTGAHAEQKPAPLTLRKSVEIALKNNFSILSAMENIEIAKHKQASAFADFFPKFKASSEVNYLSETPIRSGSSPIPIVDPNGDPAFGRDALGNPTPLFFPSTPAMALGDRTTWSISGTVTQPLFTGGAIYNSYQLAKLGVDISKIQLERTKQDIALKTVEAYFNILKAIEIAKVESQAVKALEMHLEVAEEFYKVGMIPKNDLLKAEVQLADVKQQQILAENAVELAKSAFNTILRRDVNAPVEIENVLTYEAVAYDLQESIDRAKKERPEIKEIDLKIKQSERQIKLAQSRYFPKITAVFNAFKNEGQSFSPIEEGWVVGGRAEWNFWEWGKKRQEVLASRSNLQRLIYVKKQLLDQIALEVKDAYLKMKEAEKNIFVARKAIEQGKENFRMNLERYREQVGTVTDVLDAQTLLTQVQTNYFNALSDYNVAIARLKRAMGILQY